MGIVDSLCVDETHEFTHMKYLKKKKEAFGLLVLLGSIHHCTSTYSLST